MKKIFYISTLTVVSVFVAHYAVTSCLHKYFIYRMEKFAEKQEPGYLFAITSPYDNFEAILNTLWNRMFNYTGDAEQTEWYSRVFAMIVTNQKEFGYLLPIWKRLYMSEEDAQKRIDAFLLKKKASKNENESYVASFYIKERCERQPTATDAPEP